MVLPNELINLMIAEIPDIRPLVLLNKQWSMAALAQPECAYYRAPSVATMTAKIYMHSDDDYDRDEFIRVGNLDIMKIIYSNVSPCIEDGRSAIISGQLEMLKYIHSLGVNCTYALFVPIAARRGYVEIMEFLISIGADVHANNDQAIRFAAESGNMRSIEFLYSVGANISVNRRIISSIYTAENIEFIQKIRNDGVDILADNIMMSSMASIGKLRSVQFLYSMGVDIHAYNDQALNYASRYGHTNVVEFILSH